MERAAMAALSLFVKKSVFLADFASDWLKIVQ